ncbi:TPA: threonine synthase, partial [Legionella pneumophila]
MSLKVTYWLIIFHQKVQRLQMKIRIKSTRGQCVSTIDEAILSGLAGDGGL